MKALGFNDVRRCPMALEMANVDNHKGRKRLMNTRQGMMVLAQRTAQEGMGEGTDFQSDSVWNSADLLPSETGENDNDF